MRRRLAVAGVVVLLSAAGATLALTDEGASDSDGRARTSVTTARIQRRDLVARETFDGMLGYDDENAVVNHLQGTLTWRRAEGAIVRRGGALYRVDGRAVRLLYGKLPAYRTFSSGMDDGADVRQLEQNLVALGYDPDGDIDVDREFDAATTDSIERWQDDLGLTEDGMIELGEVVFAPGARRIGAGDVELGSLLPPDGRVFTTTSSSRIVSLDVSISDIDLFDIGGQVHVELPGGRMVTGSVSEIGRVAEVPSEQEGGGDPTVVVTVTLQSKSIAHRFDQAPVDVAVTSNLEKNVLAVPVQTLLALAEGGFAVEVVDGSETRLVAVEPGMYADGWVAINADLTEGTEVAVPE